MKRFFLHNKKLLVFVAIIITLLVGYWVFATAYKKISIKAEQFNNTKKLYEYFSGKSQPSSTLILFMNNAEQRYGGGFIGTVLLVSSKDGVINTQPIRSSYFYDRFTEAKPPILPVPRELSDNLGVRQLGLRDSATNVHWPDTAKDAASLFELATNTKVDNVVGVTPQVLKEILSVTGPIYLKEYDIEVTAGNFSEVVQIEVEGGRDKAQNQDPKTILGTLANAIIKKFSEQDIDSLKSLSGVADKMVDEKQLVAFSKTTELQKVFEYFNVAGKLNINASNYLLVAHNNVGADKSSQFINQQIRQDISINNNGEAYVVLNISRQHPFKAPAYQYYEPRLARYQYLVNNHINYTKVFLPLGTRLLSYKTQSSPRLYVQNGQQVIEFMFNTSLGATTNSQLVYRLPTNFKLDKKVVVDSFLAKQIGGFATKYELFINKPKEYVAAKFNSEDIPVYNNTISKDLMLRAEYVKEN